MKEVLLNPSLCEVLMVTFYDINFFFFCKKEICLQRHCCIFEDTFFWTVKGSPASSRGLLISILLGFLIPYLKKIEKNLLRAKTFTGHISRSVDCSLDLTVIERLVQGYWSLQLPLLGRCRVVGFSHPLNIYYLNACEGLGAVLRANDRSLFHEQHTLVCYTCSALVLRKKLNKYTFNLSKPAISIGS